MADIRIKDLTTTASSSASDDFIAVDGTTNGTRKLNAYSPTFGGNATVTGTLSSAGNLSVTGTSAQVILGQDSGSQLTYLIRSKQAGGAIQIVQDSATVNRWLSLGGVDNNGVYGEGLRISSNVTIPGTTASTSTSSGALVVSGGVGVAGAIYAGGNLGLANTSNILFGTDTSFYRSTGGSLNVDHIGGSLPVVYLRANGSATAAWFTDGGVCYFGSSTANGLVLRTNNTTALTISASQNATFAGNITTAAPSGGTAAAWKLGTVASVSPTSPNRTIEVDIGGTIYYIAAKTTNN